MALTLTPDQSAKVDRNRKDPTPTYYSATALADVVISPDFEAYLILLTDSVKDQIVQQFKNVKTTGSTRKDRDDLLSLALTSELADAQSKFDLYNSSLQSFTTFRQNLAVDGFETVVEIGTAITDLQITYGEDLLSLDRMQHLVTFLTLVKAAFNNGKVSADVLKEMDSFTTLVNSYKGSK